MKDIDDIVCKITLALNKQASTDLYLEAALIRLGVDSASVARDLRLALKRRIDDPTLSAEYREYARQKLEELPRF